MPRPPLSDDKIDDRLDLSRNEYYNDQYPSLYPNDYACYKEIERLFDINIKNLSIGFGADEIIGRCSKLFNLEIIDGEQYEMSYVYNRINRGTQKAIYFGNPSNKNHKIISKDELIEFYNRYNDRIIIVDEVYSGYSDYKHSLRYEIEKYPRLIIIDSTSKALGLPGIRCGFGIASAKLTNKLRSIRPVHICTSECINILKRIDKTKIKNFQNSIMEGKQYLESKYDHVICDDVPYSLLTNIGDLESKIKGRWIDNRFRVSATHKSILMDVI